MTAPCAKKPTTEVDKLGGAAQEEPPRSMGPESQVAWAASTTPKPKDAVSVPKTNRAMLLAYAVAIAAVAGGAAYVAAHPQYDGAPPPAPSSDRSPP
jgi:hypothetical protein